MVKVSIIIPVYNVAPYLEKCICSCLDQTFRDIEIILVNDGSPDSSSQIIQSYAEKDDRIVVVHKIKNEGLIYARKSGIEIARGEYLFHLDGDDFIAETAIEYLYNEARRCDADLVLGDSCMQANGRLKKYHYHDIPPGTVGQDLLYELIYSEGWFVWGKLIRRSLYDHLIYTLTPMGEDYYQIMQLVPQVKRASVVHSCIYYYQADRVGSIMNNKNRKEVSARHIVFIESVLDLMDNYPYEKRVRERVLWFLMIILHRDCLRYDKTKSKQILRRVFLNEPDLLKICGKRIYLTFCMYRLCPWIVQISII